MQRYQSNMMLPSAFLSFSAYLFVIHLATANSSPCLPAEFVDGYTVFLKRHLSSDVPASLKYEAWEKYLKEHTDCDQSLQSFLSPSDRNRVENICTPAAGKQESGNYCISKNNFTFISVNSELGTCIVRNVAVVTQHIIVACDMVGHACVPTHLEENRNNLVPRQEDPDCVTAGPILAHSFMIRAAGQLCLLALAFYYLMA
ncbi:uncharacterized protein LOC115373828 [Myripristis murdjan]|uniref:uncharacterized protein LOC115373828 n=1 Tax=Myripristis murdjan TaxID=586833 RepID=UPI001175C8DB|nr:uncharacterized protein LOC115373828 [Myripristis murdjan]